MDEKSGRVIILDDDHSVLVAMRRLLLSHGFEVLTFDGGGHFLESGIVDCCPSCLVLDVFLPDINGIDLQLELMARNWIMPIIFITGYGDIPMSVKAIKRGAVDFLSKPVDATTLIEAVDEALRRDFAARDATEKIDHIRTRVEDLTPRERQILPYVISGLLNKQVAFALGISEKTVKVHRGRIMAKMSADSVADLVRQCEMAAIAPLSNLAPYR